MTEMNPNQDPQVGDGQRYPDWNSYPEETNGVNNDDKMGIQNDPNANFAHNGDTNYTDANYPSAISNDADNSYQTSQGNAYTNNGQNLYPDTSASNQYVDSYPSNTNPHTNISSNYDINTNQYTETTNSSNQSNVNTQFRNPDSATVANPPEFEYKDHQPDPPTDEDKLKARDKYRVFCIKLPKTATEQDLKTTMGKFGEVTVVFIPADPYTNKPRGFGYVSFANEDAMNRALDAGSCEVMGTSIEIKVAEERNSEGPSPSRLFVKGLPSDATEEDLKTFFTTYGPIINVICPRDKNSGHLRDFCFVTFKTIDDTTKVLQQKNLPYKGTTLTISPAMPKDHIPASRRHTSPYPPSRSYPPQDRYNDRPSYSSRPPYPNNRDYRDQDIPPYNYPPYPPRDPYYDYPPQAPYEDNYYRDYPPYRDYPNVAPSAPPAPISRDYDYDYDYPSYRHSDPRSHSYDPSRDYNPKDNRDYYQDSHRPETYPANEGYDYNTSYDYDKEYRSIPNTGSTGTVSNDTHRRDPPGPARLFIAGLDSSISIDELRQHFKQYGTVEAVRIPDLSASGKPSDIALITMGSWSQVYEAINKSPKNIHGKPIKDLCVARPQKSSSRSYDSYGPSRRPARNNYHKPY
ncbi:hypothetical protein WA158_003783 [Blastocystis sp. Blastoise]